MRIPGFDPLWKLLLKIVLLGLLDAFAVYLSALLVLAGSWYFVPFLVLGAGGITALVLFPGAYPFRYLAPGLFFLVVMVITPVVYNIYLSFTNYSTGHILSKSQVIALLTDREYAPSPPVRYPFYAYGDQKALWGLVIVTPGGKFFLSPKGKVEGLGRHEVVDEDGDGIPESVDGHGRLSLRDFLKRYYGRVQGIRYPWKDGWLRLASLREFGYFLPRYRYDPSRDAMVDQRTGKIYYAVQGQFVAEDGEALNPGWSQWVGPANYIHLFYDPRFRRAFGRVFLWNIEWAVLSVALSFVLGLSLAILLNDRHMHLRKFYRSLLIVPYAIPAFISVLIWKGFFNADVGLFNQVLRHWFGMGGLRWLQEPHLARFTLIFTNIWLTYPYMMLVSLGALQSIPGELYEAAAIDGASPWQRFSRITFPLLMISIAPLLIGSFAFNFNNFTIIWLMTQGGPVVEIGSQAGATDILLSFAYKLAFYGARGNEYALAAAFGVVIFFIIASISAVSFKFTRALEEVSRGL